jgi:hypothetical protein
VIKRGWDWLGLTPPGGARIGGLVEAPELAECLTLSKNDFVRAGARGAIYLVYRKAIQEVVSRQLTAWGEARSDDKRPRTARLDRELERVLEDLADDFPLLRALVDRRSGGQKRLPMPGRGREPVDAPLFASVVGDDEAAGADETATRNGDAGQRELGKPQIDRPRGPNAEPATSASHEHEAAVGGPSGATVSGRRRPARYGLMVQFASWPGDSELGRLVDSTVWINDAHPAYERAERSRSMAYHIALAVALSLAPLAVERADEHTFVTESLRSGVRPGVRGCNCANRVR